MQGGLSSRACSVPGVPAPAEGGTGAAQAGPCRGSQKLLGPGALHSWGKTRQHLLLWGSFILQNHPSSSNSHQLNQSTICTMHQLNHAPVKPSQQFPEPCTGPSHRRVFSLPSKYYLFLVPRENEALGGGGPGLGDIPCGNALCGSSGAISLPAGTLQHSPHTLLCGDFESGLWGCDTAHTGSGSVLFRKVCP